jgi:hypothetical protein
MMNLNRGRQSAEGLAGKNGSSVTVLSTKDNLTSWASRPHFFSFREKAAGERETNAGTFRMRGLSL